MGKTTDGRSTSINADRWTDIYLKYRADFGNPVPPIPFALNELNKEITEEKRWQLYDYLIELEDYYDKIESFLTAAQNKNRGPREQGALEDMADTLCSEYELATYGRAVYFALPALASIAKKARAYSSSSKLSDEKISLLEDLLTTVNSISENVKRDFEAEIRQPKSAAGDYHEAWDTYMFARSRSLRAVGGIEDMPPEPKRPVTG